MTKTAYIQLIQIASIRKKDSILRYTLATSLLDEQGSGWVDIGVLKLRLSELFNVSPRTVNNFLWKMENGGYGRISKNRFFYLSQYNLSLKLGQEISNRKAVQFDLNTLSGSPVQFRAWMEASLLAGKPKSITRATRRERLSGTGKRTQRKYDNIQGTITRFQYAIAGKYSDYAYQRHMELEGHGFILNDNLNLMGGHDFIVYQRANLYDSQMETRRKPIRNSKLRDKKPVPAHTVSKVFFSDFDSAWKYWNKNNQDVFYPTQYQVTPFILLQRLEMR